MSPTEPVYRSSGTELMRTRATHPTWLGAARIREISRDCLFVWVARQATEFSDSAGGAYADLTRAWLVARLLLRVQKLTSSATDEIGKALISSEGRLLRWLLDSLRLARAGRGSVPST